jgi:cytosine/adenosine deaminase-related metal-dependent hydrolase
VGGEVLRDACVTIAGEKIVAVGENASGRPAQDLGNVAILPGFVNAHTHLEFSDLDSPLGSQGTALPAWIRSVVEHRRGEPEPTEDAIKQGLGESAAAGVTTLAEIATPGRWSPSFSPTIDVTVFHEVIAITEQRRAEALAAAERFASGETHKYCRGLSPHAPYTVDLDTTVEVVTIARRHGLPVAMHLAESPQETEFLATGRGPFAEMFAAMGIDRTKSASTSYRDYLDILSRAPRALVVHGNYLSEDDIATLAEHRDTMAVVYCPRTHAYFGHSRHPLEQLLAAGCTVALGTDSRASNPDLSILDEMRTVAREHPSFDPRTIVKLGTLFGARALGRDASTGSLEPHKVANLAMIALPEQASRDPYEDLLGSSLKVVATYRSGVLI